MKLLIRIFQIANYPIYRLAGSVLGRRTVRVSVCDLSAGYRYVLVPNHQSYLDIPIIISSLPFGVLWRLGPIRCFVLNEAFDIWWLRPLLVITGCFPAKAHIRYPCGLHMARSVLDGGQSVMIFPEGTRSLRPESDPKRGVAVMAAWPTVKLLPIHIEWRRSGRWRRTFEIVIGGPFSAAGMGPAEIMERVYMLS